MSDPRPGVTPSRIIMIVHPLIGATCLVAGIAAAMVGSAWPALIFGFLAAANIVGAIDTYLLRRIPASRGPA